MKANRIPFYLFIFTNITYSCKVIKTTTSQTEEKKDSTIVSKEVPVEKDTVPKAVQETVEINIHRLLKDTVTVIGVGDIMMGTNFPSEKYLPPENGVSLFKDVESILKNADVTFGNLEGVILNDGGDPKECKNPELCYLFRMPESYVTNLVNAGFDVMSIANNHAGDFGMEGRANTVRVLDSVNIHTAGLENLPFTTFMIDGMKYGFAAFAPNEGTVSIHDSKRAKALINHLDSISDIVIVSFHGGAEGKDHQHVTRNTEFYYGEDRGNVYNFSHTAVDWGADIVFGHGPHVTRAIELYQKRFISYSLGNFCTYARFNLRGVNGIAPIIKVYVNAKGEFMKGEIIPVRQVGSGIPKIDKSGQAIKKIQQLTAQDFPESGLVIQDSGLINYIESQ